MNTTQLEQLFAEYERAFSELDIKRNAALFSDTFIWQALKELSPKVKMSF
jgi:hypothetical protein